MQTRRSLLISGGTALALATRLNSQPKTIKVENWDQTIMDSHTDDLITIVKGNRSQTAYMNAARSHEVLAAHLESSHMALAIEAAMTQNRAAFDSLSIDYAGLAKTAAQRYGWTVDISQLRAEFESIPLATRLQIPEFLSQRGSWKVMSAHVAEVFRSQAKFASGAVDFRLAQCMTDATGNTSCTLTYPFASGACQQLGIFGLASAILGTIWGSAPLLIPESVVCPLCGFASAGFAVIGVTIGFLAWGYC